MKNIHIEFSDERLITPGGLVFVGQNDYQYTEPETMGKFFYKCVTDKKTYFSMHSGNYIFLLTRQREKEN